VSEDVDVYSNAQTLVQRHGPNAVTLALRQAGDMLAAGNVGKFWEWIEVMSVVKDLLKNNSLAPAVPRH
jgi:hypothetical protein